MFFLKKIILLMFLMLSLNLYQMQAAAEDVSKPFEAGVSFDWITKSQMQRDENISQIRSVIFAENPLRKFKKNDFRQKYSDYLKDNDFLANYNEIQSGKTEDKDKYYCAFYWNNIYVAYGIQHKNKPENIFYYDVLGNLRWIDVFSDNYPNLPYSALQYTVDGKLVAGYYYLSSYDQYIYSPDKTFKGRWYKENLYNRKAKIIMTRTNW